jgi:hypothetical protein
MNRKLNVYAKNKGGAGDSALIMLCGHPSEDVIKLLLLSLFI